jgi:hypothetical protein
VTIENETLVIPVPIYFEEENEMFDYNNIREITRLAKEKQVQSKKTVPRPVILTEQEQERVEALVKDMEKSIIKFAGVGEERFIYDCSKLEHYIFLDLAQNFKDKNPKFYIELDRETQMIIVDWIWC